MKVYYIARDTITWKTTDEKKTITKGLKHQLSNCTNKMTKLPSSAHTVTSTKAELDLKVEKCISFNGM